MKANMQSTLVAESIAFHRRTFYLNTVFVCDEAELNYCSKYLFQIAIYIE